MIWSSAGARPALRLVVAVCAGTLGLTPAPVHADDEDADGGDGSAPPEVKLVRPGGTFSVGLGAGTPEGLVGHARLAHGRLFGVEGLRLSVNARLSAHRQRASTLLELELPALDPFFFELGAHYEVQRLAAGDAEVKGRQVIGQLKLGRWLGDRWRLALGYRAGWLTVQNAAALAGSGLAPDGSWQQGRLLSAPSLELSYHGGWIDGESRLPLGLHLRATAEHASRWTGADVAYTRLDLKLRHGVALPWGMRLQTSAHAGALLGDNAAIPLFSRYRLGHPLADNTALSHLGPLHIRDGLGYSLGGSGILHGRVVLYVPIWRPHLYVFAGVEGGALFSRRLPGQHNLDLGGAGLFGLQWNSPIGPLNFGISLPFSMGRDPCAKPRFLFSAGGTF